MSMSFWEYAKRYTVVVTEAVFEYDTPKIVHIKNKKVGLVNRFVQLIIIVYIVVFAIVLEKGYDEFEDVLSTVTTKVEGLDYTNGTGSNENAGYRVWDSSDYVIPPQSPDSVFIMTNMWITNQTQGICSDPSAPCTSDGDCTNGNFTRNGRLNGVCNTTSNYCSMNAWCPPENENDTITGLGPKLTRAEDFTIFIKNSIQFPKLAPKFRRRNVGDDIKDGCRFAFHSENYFCPIISLRQIVDMLEHRYDFKTELATKGAVLGLQIDWECNLDRSPEHCKPKYSARRLDDPHAVFSRGFNFRYSTSWYENETMYRQLTKAYGVRINILVTGRGGKFSFTSLILTIGSGIALLALATVVSDIFVLYVLRQRSYYRRKKYQNVEGGASFFRDDTVVIGPTEKDPLLGSQKDGEVTDDESRCSSVNLKQDNHHHRRLS